MNWNSFTWSNSWGVRSGVDGVQCVTLVWHAEMYNRFTKYDENYGFATHDIRDMWCQYRRFFFIKSTREPQKTLGQNIFNNKGLSVVDYNFALFQLSFYHSRICSPRRDLRNKYACISTSSRAARRRGRFCILAPTTCRFECPIGWRARYAIPLDP